MSKIKKEKIENDICVYYIFPKAGIQIKGVVFVPPLIGGSYLEQYRTYFSQVGKAGYIFISFNYKGHKGGATGKFTLKNSMEDCLTVVRHIKRKFYNYDTFAIGACYGSVPLLYCLHHNEHFKKIALVNAISNIRQVVNFFTLIKTIFIRIIKLKKISAKKVFSDITKKTLPHIAQSEERFGLLKYENIDSLKFLFQYLFFTLPQKNHKNIPVLCCYGIKDDFLSLNKEKNRLIYESKMNQHFSQIDFFRVDTNHFLDNRKPIINKAIIDFFER